MKVDFITRHAIPNYGSILQTYATQKVLNKLGCDSEVINYIRMDETANKTIVTNCNIKGNGIKSKIKRLGYIIIQGPNVKHMHKKFSKFRKTYLKQTEKEYNSVEELKNNLPNADVYCTGSDQVWAKIGGVNYDEAYFLNFVPEGKRCISYAASLGKSKIDEELEKRLPELLKKYETILVRENTAEEIIKEKGFNNVKQVLDPTLLLNNEEWSSLAEKTKLDGKEYILVYQLHHNKQMEDYLKKLKKHTKLPIYRVHPSFYYGFKPGKFLYLPTPGQYISYIKNAKYIVTDSFHGTVFSLIFNKNFVDILPGETSTRIESILKLVNQENRIIRDFNDFSWLEKDIDYKNINKIMSEEREKSLKDFKDAIFSNTKNNINNLNIKLECAGCRMCEQICPKNAIKMEEDEEGFLRPVVDENLCINCGLCIKRCPQRNEVEKSRENQTAYAAKIKNIDTLKNSSSGGVFSVLANEYIKNKGKVYGAAYDENFNVMHIGVDTLEGLKKIRGSKYVQSNTLDTYSNVKKDLQEGKQVLYSGTACQIAGLNKFLEKNYENLLTVDIVCHGVPSQKLFKKYKEYIENKYNGRIEEISFRNKEKRGWGLNLKIRLNNGKIIRKFAYVDPYYKAFVNGDIYRECCYNCKYANSNRVGDITLADYWGLANVHPEFYDGKGVSAVIVNTQKGIDTWNKVKDELEYIETSVEFIKKYNPNLVKPTYRKNSRDYIYNKLDEKDFKKFIKENLKFKKKFKDTIRSKFSDEDIERLKGKLKK